MSKKKRTMIGTFCATKKGFGFADVEGEEEDFFIPAEKTGSAMDGDTVEIRLLTGKGRRKGGSRGARVEGSVVKVLKRAIKAVVGVYEQVGNYGVVRCDNEKIGGEIYISSKKGKGAKTGDKVYVKIEEYDRNGLGMVGEVVEVLGRLDEPGVDILSVVRDLGIPDEFPEEVLEEAERIPDEIPTSDYIGRLDLRKLKTVTIDGEEAKDLDDAITLEKTGNGYELGVHIADVSHYVREGSPLDKEARKRGTSVYLADRVIPMLPVKLSNGLCSLNQGEDRLALSCIMFFDRKGHRKRYEIRKSVIRVDHRMSYHVVHEILTEKNSKKKKEYPGFIRMFHQMRELADLLQKNRKKSGSIDFDFPEAKILLDEKGKPIGVQKEERDIAHGIIEEFMLAANRTVAEEYAKKRAPFVYRVHDNPNPEKVAALKELAHDHKIPFKIKGGKVTSKDLQRFVEEIRGRKDEMFFQSLVLQSMSRACYDVECRGHFGLACKYYSHFTSPIRRYPDLQIHRIISEDLNHSLFGEKTDHFKKILPKIASKCSEKEKRADDAERLVEKEKMAEYMSDHVGERYQGMISGVTKWGIYVQLENTVEGLVPIETLLSDDYEYSDKYHCFTGTFTGKMYCLGDPVEITVVMGDKGSKRILFALEEEKKPLKKRKKKERKDGKSKRKTHRK